MLEYFDMVGCQPCPHVTIPLLGRFKKDVGGQYHLLPVGAEIKLGIPVRVWVGRLIDI